jgi:hypothetical protein
VPASAITPATALRRLTELSGEVRAAAVLERGGELVGLSAAEPGAGNLGESLRELTLSLLEGADRAGAGEPVAGASGDPPAEVEVATPAGTVFVVRGASATLTVVAGRLALSSLVRYDMRRMLLDLEEREGS